MRSDDTKSNKQLAAMKVGSTTDFSSMKIDSHKGFRDDDMNEDTSSVASGQSSVREPIGKKETALVNFSKLLVFFSICILAILIAYLARSFLQSQEETKYQTEASRSHCLACYLYHASLSAVLIVIEVNTTNFRITAV